MGVKMSSGIDAVIFCWMGAFLCGGLAELVRPELIGLKGIRLK
jgi:hypothetical protein